MPDDKRVNEWMGLALEEARATQATEKEPADVPVGAVVIDDAGVVIGRGRNRREADGDPFAHAEIEALRDAAATRGSWRLDDVSLVVTLEPCVMCAGAILAARVPRLVYGAWDEKAGAVGSVYDVIRDRRLPHRVAVISGVRAQECADLLTDFFRRRPTTP